MTANSYYARFKELYEQMANLSNDLRSLSKEAVKAGDFDVATTKRLARLVAYEKLQDEAAKYRKLKDAADQHDEPGLFG
jgi:hypothetical protein